MNALGTIVGKHQVRKRLVTWCSSVVILLFMALGIHAQNNEFGINDELYELYQQSGAHRDTYLGMQLAQKMFKRASELGDKKGQCIALRAQVMYESLKTLNDKSLDDALDRLQTFAAKHGFWDQYYYGSSRKVRYLLRCKRRLEALQYAENTLKVAQATQRPIGIYSSYCDIGLVRSIRSESILAIDAYQNAAEYGQKNLPRKDVSVNYIYISNCYDDFANWSDMLASAQKGKSITKTPEYRLRLQRAICRAYFKLDKDDEFLKAYKELQDMNMRNLHMDRKHYDESLDVYYYIVTKNFTAAKKLLDKISDEVWTKDLFTDYYVAKGDYKNASKSLEECYREHLKRHDTLAEEDLAGLEMFSRNQQLRREKTLAQKRNNQLALNNTQLQISNSDLELGQIRSREHLAKLDLENTELVSKHQQLESRKLRDAIKSQKLQTEYHEQQQRLYELTFVIIILVILLIIAVIGISGLRTYRASRRLQAANEELDANNRQLVAARDAAAEADKKKTVFLQNMTHEIRTPLNAIVGFSTILSYGMESSEEEKATMDEAIKTNSVLLETLIDDVVGFTELEGDFSVNPGTFNIISLCQGAISAVEGRLSPNVQMINDTCDVAPGMTCITDGSRVQRVLVNLLSNAIKNTTEGSIRLAVSLLDTAGMITFSVTDTGIGVPEDKAEEIFERFKKLDEFKQGSGLGLSICRLIAEKLDGRIWLDTTHHPGARFVFQIPFVAESR